MSDEKSNKIFRKFVEDPTSVSKLFGGFEETMKYFIKNGLGDLLDPEDEFWYQHDLQDALIWNQYLNAEDKEAYIREFANKFFKSDIAIDGDKIYLILSDRDDLLFMFDDRGRDATARDIAKTVFNDEYHEHFYGDVINNFYDDCVASLNSKDESLLKNKIISELGPLSIEDIKETEFLTELWEMEGQPETLSITKENIDSVYDDEDTMIYIMENFFPDLKSDMESTYYNAYNSAYEDKLSKEVYEGLEDLLGNSGGFITMGKYPTGKDRYVYQIDITKTFKDFFTKYFTDWKSHYNQIEYFGSFTQTLNEMMENGDVERIDFRIPDYPDLDNIVSNYNEYVEIN